MIYTKLIEHKTIWTAQLRSTWPAQAFGLLCYNHSPFNQTHVTERALQSCILHFSQNVLKCLTTLSELYRNFLAFARPLNWAQLQGHECHENLSCIPWLMISRRFCHIIIGSKLIKTSLSYNGRKRTYYNSYLSPWNRVKVWLLVWNKGTTFHSQHPLNIICWAF